jgi:Tfp pilus assembly protein FimV
MKITYFITLIAFSSFIPTISNAQTTLDVENQKALSVLLNDFDRAKAQMFDNPAEIAAGSDYVVQPGDTLHKIAVKVYGNSPFNLDLIKRIMMDQNPEAFFRGNENYLFSGAVIKTPTLTDIKSYVFAGGDGSKFPTVPQSEWIRYP